MVEKHGLKFENNAIVLADDSTDASVGQTQAIGPKNPKTTKRSKTVTPRKRKLAIDDDETAPATISSTPTWVHQSSLKMSGGKKKNYLPSTPSKRSNQHEIKEAADSPIKHERIDDAMVHLEGLEDSDQLREYDEYVYISCDGEVPDDA